MKRAIRMTVAALLLVWGGTEPAGAQVTSDGVTFYSDFSALHAQLFYPAGFSESGSAPGVVLAPDQGMTAAEIEAYGERFAERGMVAMVVDYRGWGRSGGFVTLDDDVRTHDNLRRVEMDDVQVRIRRGRVVPAEQIMELKLAVAYLQGEPGVDPERIGLWGTGAAGGYVVSFAAIDPRIRAGVAQAPAIPGRGQDPTPVTLDDDLIADWIHQARTGRGILERGEDGTLVDVERRRAAAEYRPFLELTEVPEDFPLLFIVAAQEGRFDNREHARAAAEALRGPTEVIEVPGVDHEGILRGGGFEASADAAASWLVQHLGAR